MSGSRQRSRSGGKSRGPALHSGELKIFRQEKDKKEWSRRYFALYKKELLYGVSKSAKEQKRIRLADAVVVQDYKRAAKCQFKIIFGKGHVFLRADTTQEMEQWIRVIEAEILRLSSEAGGGADGPAHSSGAQKKVNISFHSGPDRDSFDGVEDGVWGDDNETVVAIPPPSLLGGDDDDDDDELESDED